jgi:hypothetical protein
VSTPSHARSSLPSAAEYVPRRPHETVLYGIVREHLATFLAQTERAYAAPLPKYVVDTFEHYLGCGDLAGGFLRCHCEGCGHDVLVAFSCKRRGLCPSCGARRMCNEAAVLVDRILPNAPLRQWVMSLPFELRGLAATRPDVLGAMERILAEEIERLTLRLAGVVDAATGCVGFPQRFGSSLNLHVHLHTLAVDAVFEKTAGGGVRVHEAPAPSKDAVGEVAQRVRDRFVRWLRRHGYLDERGAEDRSNAPAEPSALEACAQLALAGGAFLARPSEPLPLGAASDADLERKERRFSAMCDGFDLHCAVRLEADDAEGRERLVRSFARAPFALDRIEVLRSVRIAYLLKVPRKGRTHRVMAPMDFMARLCALVPPPQIPLIRYHGVFAPRSSWRPLVTPKPPPHAAKHNPKHEAHAASASPAPASTVSPASTASPAPASPAPAPASPAPASTAPLALPASVILAPQALTHALAEQPALPSVHFEATTLTVKHWGRLLHGELFATTRVLSWAVLMKRTWGLSVLACPRCARRMHVMATITAPATTRRILEHLGARADPLPRAPARAPPMEQLDLELDSPMERFDVNLEPA